MHPDFFLSIDSDGADTVAQKMHLWRFQTLETFQRTIPKAEYQKETISTSRGIDDSLSSLSLPPLCRYMARRVSASKLPESLELVPSTPIPTLTCA